MELSYDSRRLRESGRPSGRPSAARDSCASNSALTAALRGDTPSDPGLGRSMAARMAAAFGPGFAAAGGDAATDGAGVIQMKPIGEAEPVPPVSGAPEGIRAALERSSSVSLADVRVHYDSPKPAEIGALAYARGSDVYMGPGQEKYLGHELTHVVQQKQGLVHSTGSVGGLPVNTSPSLENAADRMQVSAAPEAAAAPASGGVVQGVFVDANGKRLSSKDVKVMISMMEDSLGSHQKYVEGMKGPEETEANQAILSEAYRKQKEGLRDRYKQWAKDKTVHHAEDVLGGELNAAQQSADAQGFQLDGKKLHYKVFSHTLDNSGTAYALGQKRLIENDPTRDFDQQNTTRGYLDTAGGFDPTSTEIFDEVRGMPEYDPAKGGANFDEMRDARMECSTTFLGAKQNATGAGATKADLDEQARRKKQFDDAAEVSRKGAVKLRKTDDIGFGDLYPVLCGINRAARKGEAVWADTAEGGKIRGRGTGTKNIQAVGSGKLPEDVFRTLSSIAAQMNEIKQIKDPDLQKTKAIKLAAFAYQITVAEHIFEDGNGRSCRLLADTILQTFGLPPHAPMQEEAKMSGTIGEQLDFDKGARTFLGGVVKGNQIMQDHAAQQAAQAKKKKHWWEFWKKS